MEDIKPIETYYDGIYFRSRLEARWAVFFNYLGIEYNYEKEGYPLGKEGKYLPDFWLPEQECWIEIKGKIPTIKEMNKLNELSIKTNTYCHIFGEFKNSNEDGSNENYALYSCCGSLVFKCLQTWGMCSKCGKLDIVFDGYEKYVCDCTDLKGYRGNNPKLLDAYKTARSARFEFGEKPSLYRNNGVKYEM